MHPYFLGSVFICWLTYKTENSMTTHAKLSLRHFDIRNAEFAVNISDDGWRAPDGSFYIDGRQSTTFAVNLEHLLGLDYDREATYVLRLCQIAYGASDFYTTELTSINGMCIIEMSGLDFINSTYTAGTDQGKYPLCVLNIADDVASVHDFSPSISSTRFRISNPRVNLKFDLIRAIDGAPAEYKIEQFPDMVYNFSITKV
jgi:hypothetical protein